MRGPGFGAVVAALIRWLRRGSAVRAAPATPEQAAAEIVDAAEAAHLPLRIPVGDAARAILAARRAAPDTVPFIPGRPPAAPE